jgi:hypothetical protein
MAAISASLPGASKNEGEKRGKKERKKSGGGEGGGYFWGIAWIVPRQEMGWILVIERSNMFGRLMGTALMIVEGK